MFPPNTNRRLAGGQAVDDCRRNMLTAEEGVFDFGETEFEGVNSRPRPLRAGVPDRRLRYSSIHLPTVPDPVDRHCVAAYGKDRHRIERRVGDPLT
jgi:hypothetical protein